jgi:hypothetical protein
MQANSQIPGIYSLPIIINRHTDHLQRLRIFATLIVRRLVWHFQFPGNR